MSEPYWEPLAAVPHGIVPPATSQDGKWLRAAGGVAVWESWPPGAANGLATLDANGDLVEAQAPRRLQDTCYPITDWNLALRNGWWIGDASAVLNKPPAITSGWSIGQVWNLNDDWVTQRVWDAFVAGTPTWERRRLNGVWGTWEAIMQTMTQAAYTALSPKNPNTLYIIVG